MLENCQRVGVVAAISKAPPVSQISALFEDLAKMRTSQAFRIPRDRSRPVRSRRLLRKMLPPTSSRQDQRRGCLQLLPSTRRSLPPPSQTAPISWLPPLGFRSLRTPPQAAQFFWPRPPTFRSPRPASATAQVPWPLPPRFHALGRSSHAQRPPHSIRPASTMSTQPDETGDHPCDVPSGSTLQQPWKAVFPLTPESPLYSQLLEKCPEVLSWSFDNKKLLSDHPWQTWKPQTTVDGLAADGLETMSAISDAESLLAGMQTPKGWLPVRYFFASTSYMPWVLSKG